MVDEVHVQPLAHVLWHGFLERVVVSLASVRLGQPEPDEDPVHVRVDGEGRASEGVRQYAARALRTDAREGIKESLRLGVRHRMEEVEGQIARRVARRSDTALEVGGLDGREQLLQLRSSLAEETTRLEELGELFLRGGEDVEPAGIPPA
jgi:hypothetical protein